MNLFCTTYYLFEYYVDITSPSVILVVPEGGEKMQGGSSFDIIWNASDIGLGVALNGISIYYSTNSGQTYPYTITSGISNNGI